MQTLIIVLPIISLSNTYKAKKLVKSNLKILKNSLNLIGHYQNQWLKMKSY